jgi:transcriptional regulator with XRE-family HTH domain
MSIEQEMSTGLEFDLADRMRRALRISDLGVQEMAEYLGVARTTVSNWINGRIVPSKQSLRLWAIRTGVPFGWLETGRAPINDDGGPESYTTRDLNPEPADSASALVIAFPIRLAVAA